MLSVETTDVTRMTPPRLEIGHKTHPSTFLLCFLNGVLMKLKIDEMPEKVTEDVTFLSADTHTPVSGQSEVQML